ncbi:unnamed protein product [Nesidiocoris tenuis]|uniref:Uncharacterized protein n=1 Tax=Nesidiocoris tenuis TaxID=355587 RepID=A0A6H5GTJ8_9HEMI|nr:unnamed protein product [Nesidiocoris tenuis]CAB0013497.1 unnamed protein product [Nesidiocoris tenuis]CAB0013501.1 unnamed protein product [Nesidiocoris tenuis]
MVHNEKICHDTGERRLHYLKQIKCILDKLDSEPCPLFETKDPNLRPLNSYEAYRRLGKRRVQPEGPLVTSVPIKEIRRTSHLAEHLHENCRNMQYVAVDFLENQHVPMDVPGRKKSVELKGGFMIPNCSCTRRDGLQDHCELQGCLNKELCMADPSPLCEPANPRGVQHLGLQDETAAHGPPPKPCCCDTAWTAVEMPTGFQCYPCTHTA